MSSQTRRSSSSRPPWSGATARALKEIYGSSFKSAAALFISKAKELRVETGVTGPPFDPRRYAEAMGIRVEEKDDIALDGLLKRGDKKEFVVHLKRSAHPLRKNFTLAHELAHTFFYDDLLEFSERFRGRTDLASYDVHEERLCDLAAAELLMPSLEFKNDVLQGGISPLTLRTLMNRYGVSLRAIGLRASHLIRGIACALWLPHRHAFNLEWITPASLKPLILCESGASSVELASDNPGQVVTRRDTLYCPNQGGRIVKRTSSLRFRSGQVLSVIFVEPPQIRQERVSRSPNGDGAESAVTRLQLGTGVVATGQAARTASWTQLGLDFAIKKAPKSRE